MAIFLSEYGLIITIFLLLINLKKQCFHIINNKNILFMSMPFVIILFLGISTHFQDNILFWLIFFNSNLLNKTFKEIS